MRTRRPLLAALTFSLSLTPHAALAQDSPRPHRRPRPQRPLLFTPARRPPAAPASAPPPAPAPTAPATLALPSIGDPRTISVQPTVAAQLRLTGASGDAPFAAPTLLELRRLRPRLVFLGLQGRLLGQFALNTTPSSLELMDFWVEYRMSPNARVRVGLTKTPFTAYRLGTYLELLFVDWALVTRTFGSERQLGVEVHNRTEDSPFEYSVGLFNGTTLRAAHGIGPTADYGETPRNYSDLRTYNAPDAPHPELVARFAWHAGRRATYAFAPAPNPVTTVTTNAPPPNTPATPLWGLDLGVSTSLDAHPTLTRDFTYQLAPEAALRIGPWSLSATGYLGYAPLTRSAALAPMGGALVETSVVLARRVALAARFARIERSQALLTDARSRADGLVNAAPTPEQRETLRTQYRDAGTLRAEQELTAAVTVSIFGPALIFQADVSYLVNYRTDGERDGVRYRFQLQSSF